MEISKVEHLLLLVGDNPLPNAVAGRLLVESNGTITFFCTTETKEIASRLKSWLGHSNAQLTFKEKEVEEANPVEIASAVRSQLNDVKASRVGLHYTGGTKLMAVHSYRALERWAGKRRDEGQSVDTGFSYLDARTFQIVFDPPDLDNVQTPQHKYVGNMVKITLSDLEQLHGWRIKTFRRKPILPKTAQTLVKITETEESFRRWKEWKEQTLRPCRKTNSRNWKEDAELKEMSLVLPLEPMLDNVNTALRDELGQPSGNISIGEATRASRLGSPQEFCKWLDGSWLETIVLHALQNCHNCSLHDVGMNLESGPDDPLATRYEKFEFDVVAIRGYQLFAFSCGTSLDKGELKLKLFEAFVRARQLGGDEARVALVCCLEESSRVILEREMRRDVDPYGRIKVFGRMHIANLADHLKTWIVAQSGKEN